MKNLLLSLLAAALLCGTAHAQQVQPLDEIVAVVDEDVILKSELDRAMNNILAQYAGQEAQLPPMAILQRQVLERLILMRLQTERAAASGIRVTDAQIDATVGAIAEQNGMSVDQLRAQLASDGLVFDDFRSSLREELLTQQLQQRFAQGRIVVSEGEVDAAMSAAAAGGSQYRLAHILVALPDGATPEQIGTGQEKVDGIKALIDRGDMEFAAAAVRYSDSPNALEGGDLGWRRADEIPPVFGSAVRTMQPGEVLGPVRGPSGFQLLQLVDVRQQGAGEAVVQYNARHILIRSGTDAASDDAARARAEALRSRIVAGEDFATVATEASEDASSSARGGDLGWFGANDFGPDFGSQVAPLQDGEVSQPFRTQAGWHVVQKVASRETQVDDERRRAAVRESIGQRKMEDEWERYLRELRSEAYVDIRVGTDADGGG
ncbi:peptidylprolyl isomerase [Luteimonas dalianensis]|uniref:peptidylprolyl isomerase n=1 Tax=Luteimonas dalianensis TaxID=1148196 RepID=UPI003BF24FC5